MDRTSTLVAVEIDVDTEARAARVIHDEEPFRILVAANFSGGAGRNRRPIGIDRDNFDQVMALLAPQLKIIGDGRETAIEFRELDDFHPDNLFQRLAPFQALRDLRKRVGDQSTFPALASHAGGPAAEVAHLTGADVLRMLTGEDAPEGAAPEKPLSAWDRLISEITKGYTEPASDPRQADWIARTDAAIAGEMRALLHHADFQALESAWRGLYFLVRRIETGEHLKLYLLDLPQDELGAGGLGDLSRAFEQESWAVVVGLYQFAADHEETLSRVAAMAEDNRAPFLAGLTPQAQAASSAFQDLRASLKAQWIGLAAQRFLLRLPYGEATSETESFAFEEMPLPPEHNRYLWGHPALACACLLAEAFQRDGWRMHPAGGEIDGLPLHVYRHDGKSEATPCAEDLPASETARLLENGFMPLTPVTGTDSIRLLHFQSIAQPSAPLAGKWQ